LGRVNRIEKIRLGQARPRHELPDLKRTNRSTDRTGSANKNKDKARIGYAQA
jgi:hypothetical protein